MDDASAIRDILFNREQCLIQPPRGSTRMEIEALLAEDFCEIGASGGACNRAEGIDALMQRAITPLIGNWRIEEFSAHAISKSCYLTTYILTQPARTTRRATIWRLEGQIWRAVFHQGTIHQ